MPVKKAKTEKALITAAESLGSALGSLAARATRAKRALIPAKSTRRQLKRQMKVALRRASGQATKAEKTAHRAGQRIMPKARKLR